MKDRDLCVYRSAKTDNGCKVLNCKCEPDTCWRYQTREVAEASIAKAQENHRKCGGSKATMPKNFLN